MLENKKQEIFITEKLKQEDIGNFIIFFKENISQLDFYSEVEKEQFISKRNFDYIKSKIDDENSVFVIVKNKNGVILSSVEGEIKTDKITNKKVGIVRWIIVGKSTKNEKRQDRMNIGKNIGILLEKTFIERGCKVLRAEIKESNIISLNFSKRFGFKPSSIKHEKSDMKWYFKNI